MNPNKVNKIILELLQKSLAGKISDNDFNPNFLAEAIEARINFEKPYHEIRNDLLIEGIKESLVLLENEMNEELNVNKENKLLCNFIRGKLTAYMEIFDVINKITNGERK